MNHFAKQTHLSDVQNAEPDTEAFSGDELRVLAARASSLDERLAGQCVPVADPIDPSKADAAFKNWLNAVSGNDETLLRRVCAHRGLDLETIKPLFGEVSLAPGRPLPQWVDTFAWLFDALQQEPGPEDTDKLVGEKVSPFETFFYPLVAAARQRRDARADQTWPALCSERALSDLDRGLLKPLMLICARALNDQFSLSLYTTSDSLGMAALLDRKQSATTIKDRFATFIATLRKDGLKAFFAERPVIARMLADVVEQWQVATLEFLERLDRDLANEITVLGAGVTPGRVVQITANLSDLHNGGRSVYKVTFDTGLCVGYKPRDLGIDVAWSYLLNWLDANGAPKSAGFPPTQACDGYGWVKWLTPEDCATKEEAEEFFRRSGATLCLIRMLQGNDFHFENIVACGPVPIPVDLETIMVARPKELPALEGISKSIVAASRRIEDSVVATGYLPIWVNLPGGQAVVMGGLDVHQPLAAKAANQEARPKDPNAHNNVPRLNGTPLRVSDYEAELVAGYEAMFAFLSSRRDEIAASDGPLDRFANLKCRAVLRPTRVYGFLLHRSLGRGAVVDGAAWSLHLDFVYQMSLTRDETLPIANVCDYERTSMSHYNIPFFEGRTTSRDLFCGDGTVVRGYFRASCLDEIRRRLLSLTPDHLRRDRFFIRQALCTTAPPEMDCGTSIIPSGLQQPPATREQLVTVSQDLAEAIEQTVIREGGDTAWLGVVPVTADERTLQIQPVGPALLTGTIGIGLFQAALYQVTGEHAYRTRSLSTIAALFEAAQDLEKLRASARLAPVGLSNGIGGLIYGLTLQADLLKDDRMLDLARFYAGLLDDWRLDDCKDQSLFSGLAGALVGLSTLYQRNPDPAIADRIRACADRLIANRRATLFGGHTWRDQTWSLPQVGLMHGASGIALALTRAGQDLDTDAYQEAVEQALTYESQMFERCGGWPDLRDIADKEAVTEAECRPDYANGAAGIGFARLAIAKATGPGDDLKTDVSRAIGSVRAAALASKDELFAGNFGRIVFLIEAAKAARDETLEKETQALVTTLLSMAEDAGSFQWPVGADGDHPCLFNGASGIGLALLWLARPDIVPNIFVFEGGHKSNPV